MIRLFPWLYLVLFAASCCLLVGWLIDEQGWGRDDCVLVDIGLFLAGWPVFVLLDGWADRRRELAGAIEDLADLLRRDMEGKEES